MACVYIIETQGGKLSMKMCFFLEILMKIWFCFSSFYMYWQTDMEDAVEAFIYNKEKQQRDFLLINESGELKQTLDLGIKYVWLIHL